MEALELRPCVALAGDLGSVPTPSVEAHSYESIENKCLLNTQL